MIYASILMLNMATITHREQADKLAEYIINKPKKFNYKPNNKQIICDIKTDFVKMLSARSVLTKVFKQLFLLKKIKSYAYVEVVGRSKPRNDPKRHSTLKSHPKSPL
jgi:hypothetical protein